jgi:hypothetical protein
MVRAAPDLGEILDRKHEGNGPASRVFVSDHPDS